ncbi:uncharacterized protein N7469_011284 [Penicillium citrinum]|uniref:Uncharacterized protein n=1 Tax=Penicillium citrinum TaxID=5077 RepID=A0A9W9NEW5_PENCI|nr:uncharacterized protein N7469_011284 [Penicillium citrinum]KAJ5217659.1 hypothetical protein N7469_011284 [Penicillium citrinum]
MSTDLSISAGMKAVRDSSGLQDFEAIRLMAERCPKEERYGVQLAVMEKLLNVRDDNTEAIALWYQYVEESGVWKRDDEPGVWLRAQKISEKHAKNVKYIDSIREKACLRWGEDNALPFFTRILTKTSAEHVNTLLLCDVEFEDMRCAVNHEILNRLQRRGRGHRRDKMVIQGDLARAAKSLDTSSISADEYKKHGLKFDDSGFLVGLAQGELPAPSLEDVGAEDRYGRYVDEEKDAKMDDGRSVFVPSPSPSDPDRSSSEEPVRPDYQRRARRHGGINLPANRRPVRRRPIDRENCTCELSKGLRDSFTKRAEERSDRLKLVVLRRVVRSLCVFTAEKICDRHTRALCSMLGLYIRQFTHAELLSRLNYAARQIGDWDKFVAKKVEWFSAKKLDFHVVRTSFRLEPRPEQPRIAALSQTGLSLEDVCTRVYGTPRFDGSVKDRDIQEKGSVILPGLFAWLEDDISNVKGVDELGAELGIRVENLLQLIHVEFDMYDYHYSPAVARARMGWNRSMFHSLAQQLTRQDVCYYAAYVAARPDHAWRLISFPYYTKSAYPGEDTEFIHIDLAIGDYLATGRGGYALQGSVSFTDEDEDNCSIVLPMLHKREILQRYWDMIKDDPDASVTGHTVAIAPWMWGPEFIRELGTDFERAICMKGDVRLTLPTIPHGSNGPATRLRRTIMPWFGFVHEDHERLETAEAGTWSDISAAHRDLSLAAKIPSGSTCHVFAVQPYTFPGTAQLTGLGAIADALVGRVKWSEWCVTVELDILFGEDRHAAHEWIKMWRRRATARFVEAFRSVISAEKAAYGEHSFFHLMSNKLPIPPPHLMYQKDLGDEGSDGEAVGGEAVGGGD